MISNTDKPHILNTIVNRAATAETAAPNPESSTANLATLPLVLLHGLFGSADNWRGRAQVYAADRTIFSMDLRNHGASIKDNVMNYPLMAADVVATLDAQNIEQCVLLGHSMGGKVAMELACSYPQRVERLIIVDIAPRAYQPHHQKLIDAMLSINLQQLEKRNDAEPVLTEVEEDPGVRAFLLKSLEREQKDKNYSWRFNLQAIADNYKFLSAAINLQRPYVGQTLFIKGALSDYLEATDREQIGQFFPDTGLKIIDAAGHWPHAEKPTVFDHLLLNFLENGNSRNT